MKITQSIHSLNSHETLKENKKQSPKIKTHQKQHNTFCLHETQQRNAKKKKNRKYFKIAFLYRLFAILSAINTRVCDAPNTEANEKKKMRKSIETEFIICAIPHKQRANSYCAHTIELKAANTEWDDWQRGMHCALSAMGDKRRDTHKVMTN